MIILKVTRNQGFTLFLEDIFFEKTRNLPPPLPALPRRFRVKNNRGTRVRENIVNFLGGFLANQYKKINKLGFQKLLTIFLKINISNMKLLIGFAYRLEKCLNNFVFWWAKKTLNTVVYRYSFYNIFWETILILTYWVMVCKIQNFWTISEIFSFPKTFTNFQFALRVTFCCH